MAIIFLEIVKATAGRDTQRSRLREGCHCARLPSHYIATGKNARLFGELDQNKTRFSTYVSQCAESKAATVKTSDLLG